LFGFPEVHNFKLPHSNPSPNSAALTVEVKKNNEINILIKSFITINLWTYEKTVYKKKPPIKGVFIILKS
jgi:hypothetical protein